MELYKDLAALFLATEASPLRLAGVEFWIDPVGPWAGQLTFSLPTSKWNAQAMADDVALLAFAYPEINRIVARYAN